MVDILFHSLLLQLFRTVFQMKQITLKRLVLALTGKVPPGCHGALAKHEIKERRMLWIHPSKDCLKAMTFIHLYIAILRHLHIPHPTLLSSFPQWILPPRQILPTFRHSHPPSVCDSLRLIWIFLPEHEWEVICTARATYQRLHHWGKRNLVSQHLSITSGLEEQGRASWRLRALDVSAGGLMKWWVLSWLILETVFRKSLEE